MGSTAEWITIAVIGAVWLFVFVLLRKKQKATAAELGIVKEVDEASARVRAFVSTALAVGFVGWLLYNRSKFPPQNAPLVWFFVALMAFWVGFAWLRWLRRRRR